MKTVNLKKLIIFCVACICSLGLDSAYAEEGSVALAPPLAPVSLPHYAAMSLIGDSISIVYGVQSTGSTLDRNDKQKIDIPNKDLDNSALVALNTAMAKSLPGIKTDLLVSNDAELYKLQQALFANDTESGAALDELKRALTNNPEITHLVLVTKHRSEARLKLQSSSFGNGKLEGLGFYVDNRLMTRRADTEERGRGVIAPYTYMTVRLIDTRSWKVIAEKTADNSTTFANAGDLDHGINAWDSLNAAQKTVVMKRLLQATVWQATTEMLAKKPI